MVKEIGKCPWCKFMCDTKNIHVEYVYSHPFPPLPRKSKHCAYVKCQRCHARGPEYYHGRLSLAKGGAITAFQSYIPFEVEGEER